MLHSFLVSGVRTEVCSVRVGRKAEMYCTRPRNWCTCFVAFGMGQFRIRFTLLSSTSIPHTEI